MIFDLLCILADVCNTAPAFNYWYNGILPFLSISLICCPKNMQINGAVFTGNRRSQNNEEYFCV